MNWPEAMTVFFGAIGFACILHGFPDIKIGGKHEYHEHNYYDGTEEGED